jgi:DNA-binding transcriptional regulator YbjK
MEGRKEADREHMKQEIKACLENLAEKMIAQIASFVSRLEDTNEKFQVLQGALVSRTVAHLERRWPALERLRPGFEGKSKENAV